MNAINSSQAQEQLIPLLPLPYKSARRLLHGFLPLSAIAVKFLPSLEQELEESRFGMGAKEYVAGALSAFTFYFASILLILAIWAFRTGVAAELNIRLIIFGFSFIVSIAIFSYILMYPRWVSSKIRAELERNLLFAARHLMIQTSAGVPLFDSIVSISEEYGDPHLNYGAISREFKKIVREVKGGKELTQALEESAIRNPSTYYRRALWQLANAGRAGANISFVLKDIVEFLSSEQRIAIRNYGSQLNPLALFYMFACIIMPTMAIIFLSIMATVSNVPVGDAFFALLLIVLIVVQIMFLGLIKSRRPAVAL